MKETQRMKRKGEGLGDLFHHFQGGGNPCPPVSHSVISSFSLCTLLHSLLLIFRPPAYCDIERLQHRFTQRYIGYTPVYTVGQYKRCHSFQYLATLDILIRSKPLLAKFNIISFLIRICHFRALRKCRSPI